MELPVMSEFIQDIDKKVIPKVDKWGFTIKPEISDHDHILICLRNAPCGTDRKQSERLIKEYEKRDRIVPFINRLRNESS